MSLWIAIILVGFVAGFWIGLPFLRARTIEMSGADGAISIYRDQLDEIERDLKEGLIRAEEADAAKQEVERRALYAARHLDGGMAGSHRSWPMALSVATFAVVSALGVYAYLGKPGLPDSPLEARKTEVLTKRANAGDMVSRIQLLIDRTEKNPDNFEDWWMLAEAHKAVGDNSSAAEAYRQAAVLSGDRPAVISAYAEALTVANGNKVPAGARVIFEQVMRETGEPRATYYVALAKAQAQDFEGAIEGWMLLLQASSADAPWVPTVRRDVVNMARFLNHDVTLYLPDATPAEIAAAGGAEPSLTPADGSGQAALLARIEEDSSDYRAWIDLINLQAKSGDEAAAVATLDKARSRFSGAPFLLQKLAETERLLGLDALGDTGRGPDAEAMAAAAEMTQAERDEMIAGMVAGLAARLEEEPNDPDGWVMLVRSYATLGDVEKAKGAAAKARELFANDARVLGLMERAFADLSL
ncbi:cytochrome c-type biogenesis protein CcmH [Shimia isoporae]|uniref:Cytochrome c-type biogenesis protein CcmH n=1 Tax=Shimia isoporae TaxID=647720 RepID=A0A4R1N3F3_9RHOB|nr:c-type cytochrome biogenesis protein CcmI [Shimia isoporae]TCL00778.1 cytochrome c-type biogenesis protein CcmH [Shimia isoporae]